MTYDAEATVEDLFEITGYIEDHETFQWEVFLDEELSQDDELIDRLAVDLLSAEGVTAAHHEDREVMLVGGPITEAQLGEWLEDWFRANT